MHDYTKPNVNKEAKSEGVKAKKSESTVQQKTKQKLFISLPMYGRSEDDILNEMKEIGRKFHENYEVIDSFHQEEDPNGIDKYSGIWYLGRSIQLMRTADLVVFHKNWANARGCVIEHRICELYDLPYIEMI